MAGKTCQSVRGEEGRFQHRPVKLIYHIASLHHALPRLITPPVVPGARDDQPFRNSTDHAGTLQNG
ncbi:hypothetical protein E2C01_001199 [Portunus trituberculatus]|uniref:Uncharacterized protein n=1 Tax=Portunus trituberculatus TaxID=210409 RepID=A0A5B7CH12_PORTR|nr:hypothetical protein [Portunus trituberculatus]